jgi:multiple antibiotic resistance protein
VVDPVQRVPGAAMMGELASFAAVSLSAVFVVVDPFAAVPFFLALTADEDGSTRRATARRAATAAGAVLAAFALSGTLLFRLLGISMGAFRIAGGLLLLIMAVDMLRTRPSEARITAGEVESGRQKDDVAIVPLAMPILAGPGSIATVVVLMGRARSVAPWQGVIVLASIAIVAFASYLLLAGASRVDRVLGKTGLAILERASGLLLAAIAIQFMVDGAGEALPGLVRGR